MRLAGSEKVFPAREDVMLLWKVSGSKRLLGQKRAAAIPATSAIGKPGITPPFIKAGLPEQWSRSACAGCSFLNNLACGTDFASFIPAMSRVLVPGSESHDGNSLYKGG